MRALSQVVEDLKEALEDADMSSKVYKISWELVEKHIEIDRCESYQEGYDAATREIFKAMEEYSSAVSSE